MARPLTLDLEGARRSLEKCLKLQSQIICPGHREPLVTGVKSECDAMLRHLEAGGGWPLLG